MIKKKCIKNSFLLAAGLPFLSVFPLNYKGLGDNKRFMEDIAGDVVIKEWCWIGAGAIILKGVTIGPRFVIAAGSGVTKDVHEE